MQLTDSHKQYWQKNIRVTGLLLVIWFVVTYVVNTPWRRTCSRIGACPTPFFIRGSRSVQNTHYSLHNIINIGKATSMFSIIKNFYFFIQKNIFYKFKNSHIWSAPRSINRKKSASCYRHVIKITIRMSHYFI